jgi:hypothetical protein
VHLIKMLGKVSHPELDINPRKSVLFMNAESIISTDEYGSLLSFSDSRIKSYVWRLAPIENKLPVVGNRILFAILQHEEGYNLSIIL